MAQGRIISPDFWTDVKMTRLSPHARLFYIGTWNFAYCDQGHLPDDVDELKFKILPADAVEAGDLLAELMGIGRIVRESVGDRTFLRIPTFAEHQRKDDPRFKRRCPVCNHGQPRESTQEHARALRGMEGSGREERGGDTRGARPSRFCSKHPAGTTAGCLACKAAREKQEAWDTNKPSHVKRIRRTDPHTHEPDVNGYCPTCGEK
jgi:hypothetical protein